MRSKRFVAFAVSALLVVTGVGPAAAADIPELGVINGDLVDHNFAVRDLQPVNNIVSIDTRFLGNVTIAPGANNAGTVLNDNTKSFMLESTTSAIATWRGGINRTSRTGIETRVMFSSTDAMRSLFEVRSMVPATGVGTWPTLLRFDASGKIKDWTGTVLRSYEANRWYDISIDLDPPKQRYSVWLDGEPLIKDLSLGNYAGILQNKIIQFPTPTGKASQTYIDYLRAGTITPAVETIHIDDGSVAIGEVAFPQAIATPEGAVVGGYTLTSSDENIARPYGMGILARGAGTATITAVETRSGAITVFSLTVKEPEHQSTARTISRSDLNAALFSGVRAQADWGVEQINSAFPQIQEYMGLSDADLAEAVRADSSTISLLNSPTKFGIYARQFARLYEITGDPAYAKRSLVIMYNYALDYPRIVALDNEISQTASAAQPDFTWAFGALLDSDVWSLLEPSVTAGDLKQLIQEVLVRKSASIATNAVITRGFRDNRDPYSARPAAVAALMLTDPLLMRQVVDSYDLLLSPENYFADGFWHEETPAYSDQVAGNVRTTIEVIKSYVDPEWFQDTRLGLSLDRTDLTGRWPLLTKSLSTSARQLIYPDGETIPLNDAYGKSGSAMPLPIVEEGLKNIELYDTGYYGLRQGDQSEATHVGVYAPKTNRWGSGHHHFNFNRIDLWGGGVELLPFSGYVVGTSYADNSGRNLRYPAMSPIWGNTPWVWRADGLNQKPSEEWARPAVLAYDDGRSTDKRVQVIETSVLGVADKGAEVNRRLEMMVNLEGNRNYILDLTRLKGGQAHEIYQRGAELEPMGVEVEGLAMTETGQPNLSAYLASINSTQGNPLAREWLLNPRTGSGSNDFNFKWTGSESGASLHTFMNGVPGSDVFMTQVPRTRVIKTKADETRLTAPHLTRRTITTSPDQITKYGAVYEAMASGQGGLVDGVRWIVPDDNDPMTMIAEVHAGPFKDLIYVSNDEVERTVSGVTFAGAIALARLDAQTGELLSSYVYGNGKVVTAGSEMIGIGAERLRVVATSMSSTNRGLNPEVGRDTITVEGTFANPDDVVGGRVLVRFADGSGFAVKVSDVDTESGGTVLSLDGYTPFEIRDGQIKTTFRPQVSIPGDAYVIFHPVTAGEPDEVAPSIPTVSSPESGSSIENAKPAISGETEPGASVTVLLDGAVLGEAMADQNGIWVKEVPDALPLGRHEVVAFATDAARNVSEPSPPANFTIVGPAAPSIVAPLNYTFTALTPIISGTSSAGSTIDVFVDGSSIGTTTADTSGDWSLQIDYPISPGWHAASAMATNAWGNSSPFSGSVRFLSLRSAHSSTLPTGLWLANLLNDVRGPLEEGSAVR